MLFEIITELPLSTSVYCLKRCENCGLKSVVEKHVFSVSKKKKCVWYHGLNNIFQCSKNIKYVFGMCVLNDKKKLTNVLKYHFF